MTYVITEPCIGTCDTSCVEVCPVDCIHGPLPVDDILTIKTQGDEAKLANISLFIDPDLCIDCGVCVDECPVDAIFMDDDVPEPWHHYIELNAKFFDT